MTCLNIRLLFMLGYCFITGVLCTCGTFASRCSSQIGRVVVNEESSENIFNLTALSSMYFSFAVSVYAPIVLNCLIFHKQPSEFPSVKILASVYYGNIEIFVAYGSEVSPTQFVLRTDNGFQDILEVVSLFSVTVEVSLNSVILCSLPILVAAAGTLM